MACGARQVSVGAGADRKPAEEERTGSETLGDEGTWKADSERGNASECDLLYKTRCIISY